MHPELTRARWPQATATTSSLADARGAPPAPALPSSASHPSGRRPAILRSVRSRLTSSHFVGRVGELAELELAVREAASGRATLVLLGGDSGVGKTRLVGELERRLDDLIPGETIVMLRGECVEQTDGELPYARAARGAAPARPRGPSGARRAGAGQPRGAGDDPARPAAATAMAPASVATEAASRACSRRSWS